MERDTDTGVQSISVIIPVFNGAGFLLEAIESVLAQTVQPLEILIVDDGSTDSTADVCVQYKSMVRYFHQEHQGASAARNTGITKSRGELLTFLDADDIWLPHALEAMRAPFIGRGTAEVSVGRIQRIFKESVDRQEIGNAYWGIHFSSIMVRRDIFTYVGMLNERLHLGEDLDWFFRLREQGVPLIYLDQVVLHYRRHDKNISNCGMKVSGSILNSCRESINRRRLGSRSNHLERFGAVNTEMTSASERVEARQESPDKSQVVNSSGKSCRAIPNGLPSLKPSQRY